MALQKTIGALISRISDLDIVIASLCFSLLFFIIFYAIALDLFEKLNVKRVYKLSIPVFSIAIIVVLGAISTTTVNSRLCSVCHPMRIASNELSSSVHSDVACISCHKKSSLTATPVQNLEQIRMTMNYIKGNYTLPISANVSNDACISCHKSITRGIQTQYRIKMSHSEIIEENVSCVECHEDVAHISRQANFSMMEKCSTCHNDEKVSARCDVCHQDKVWLGMKPSGNWSIKHDENWSKLHGSKSLYTCKYCHADKSCMRCHLTTMPHPEGWSFIHGEEAKTNRDDCGICHKNESTCLGCHRVEMPHTSNWLPVHQWKVKVVGENACLQCHNKKDCKDCHNQHAKSKKNMRADKL